MRYTLTFEIVSAIAYPQYYHNESPRVPAALVADEFWSEIKVKGGDDLVQRRDNLLKMIGDGELIRKVVLTPEEDHDKQRIAELVAEVARLREKQQLLGAARRLLDEIAGTETPSRLLQLRGPAEDLAQRIVDEIGHPVTDEPALGPSLRDQIDRIRHLATWAIDNRTEVASAQILVLLDDPRDTETITAMAERTGHRPGCRCSLCLPQAYAADNTNQGKR